MSYVELPFIVFFLIFFLIWRKLSNNRLKLWFLALFSLFFYSWNDPRHLALLLTVGISSFYLSKLIEVTKSRKILAFSIAIDLTILLSYKYLAFITGELSKILLVDINLSMPASDVLPIGLSFFIFQAISYSVDVYNKKTSTADSLIHYFAYLAMFPQLIAGPICRAKDILPQLKKLSKVSSNKLFEGFRLVVSGLFKKLIIADYLAKRVNFAFDHPIHITESHYWIMMTLALSLQIYFDFHAYTDIARGIGKMLGIEIKKNFNFPYFASNLQNFWKRWHITLSTWFRDYLYIPLGGSRFGSFRLLVSLLITFILSGLWHGANWTFLLWGLVHGLVLIGEKFLLGSDNLLIKIIRGVVAFLTIHFGWILFRANTISDANLIFKNILSFDFNYHKIDLIRIFPGLLFIMLLAVTYECVSYFAIGKRINNKWIESIGFGMILAFIVIFRASQEGFIYFQF